MKRLSTLFLTLAALLLALPANVRADGKFLSAGDRITPDQIADGLKVILEGGSEEESLEKYMPQLPTSGDEGANLSAMLDEGCVYQFVDAGTTNSISGDKEWLLLNVYTNKYVAYDSSNENYYLADDKASAARLTVHAADDGTYGALKKDADYTVGWDESSVTFAQISRNENNGNTVVTYLNNHFYTVIEGNGAIVGWEYRDTNAWNLRSYSEEADYAAILQSYLEGFTESTLASYAYGTDPGFIADEDVVNNLNDAYSDAVLHADGATSDEAKAFYDKLVAARAAADAAATVPVADDAYYYIFTGHPGFINGTAGGDFAIYPNSGILSWKAFDETDYSFVWHFTKDADGNYVVKNAATGAYIDKTESDANSINMLLSKENETPQILTLKSPNGKFLIYTSAYPDSHRYYNMDGHGNGSGRSGYIVSWNDGNDPSNLWYLRAVPQEVVDAINNDPDLTELRNLVSEYQSAASSVASNVGTAPFQYSQEAATAFTSAYTAARDLVEGGGTSDEYKSAATALQTAAESLTASRVELSTGYYNIVSAYPEYLKQQGVEKAMYANGSTVNWENIDDENNSQKWLITPLGNDLYTVQNALSGKYMSKPASNGASQNIQLSDDVDTIRIATFNDYTDQVRINWVNYSMMFHTAGHNSGAGASGNVVTWNGEVNTASSWVIRPTTTSGILEEQLSNEVTNASKVLQQAYTYDYDASSPQVTAASQIWSNDKEESEGTYDALIDGDITNNAYFHSNWSGSSDVKNDNLCFYKEDGFPAKSVFTFATRAQGNASLAPTIMDIYVSNDTAQGWTKLTTVYNTTATAINANVVYTSPEIATNGAKYFRMDVMQTVSSATGGQMKDGRPFFALTEMNIYPSEGLSGTALYNDAQVKEAADAVTTLIATSEQKIAAQTVAQSDIDALTAAVKTLSDSYFDTNALTDRVEEARAYVANFGDNDEWGDVQPEERDEFVAAIDAALEGYDASHPTRSEINSRLTTLNAAFDLFKSRQKMPEVGVWYYIASTDTMRQGTTNDDAFCYGNVIMAPRPNVTYAKRSNLADGVYWGGYDHDAQALADTVANDPYSMWRLVKYEGNDDTDGGDNIYALQNRATGYYLGASANHMGRFGIASIQRPYKIELLKSGEMKFTCTVSTNTSKTPLHAAGANHLVVSWEGGINSPSSWTMNPVTDDVVNAHIYIPNNKATILTLPYAYDEATAQENEIEGVKTYGIKGISADGTELYLYEKNTFEAGEPMIAVAGEIDNEPVSETALMALPLADEFSYEAKEANGLIPTFDLETLPGLVGLIQGDTVASTGETQRTINGMRGYINASKITNDDSKTTAITLYVKGSIVSNIAKTLAGAKNGKVSVYTIDGVLVKKNVKASDAKSGLTKGVYIIGGKKELVK